MKRLSFRDPLSEVYLRNNQIIRKINKKENFFFENLFKDDFYKKMTNDNWIQKSEINYNENQTEITHEKINNFTEVTEMSSYQLFLSGMHTLNIAITSLKNGYMLKDASAWNVVFYNGNPLFLDIGSFQKWNEEKTWIGYGQFIRHYLIPLILNKELKIPVSKLFLTDRDGVYPKNAKNKLGLKVFKSLKNLEFILAPSMIKSASINIKKENSSNSEINQRILLTILGRLRKKLLSLEPLASSFWTEYTEKRDHYSKKDIEIKKDIIENFFKKNNGKILDIGCNTGEFLFIASKYCIETHGIDIDEDCINFIQKNLNGKNISLANVNFSNPTPGIGWKNEETLGYIKKNLNYFDTVIFFGIIHHLITIDRIPMIDIIELLSKLTKKNLIFEFVTKKDKKFLELASVNIELYKDHTKENFEMIVKKFFSIKEVFALEYNSERTIYILEKN
jgi:SAM-dependent methyltransferase